MSAPDFTAVRRGIATLLAQCPSIKRVELYDPHEIPAQNMPTAGIWLDRVRRPGMEAAQRSLQHDDYEFEWIVGVYIELRDLALAQQQVDAVVMDIRSVFDSNPQFSDPQTGLTMDTSALDSISVLVNRNANPPVILVAGQLNVLIRTLNLS